MTFSIRVVDRLARKGGPCLEAGPELHDPFLPYDPDLHVADVSATHVALLNKFNVVEHHLLVVTRDFEDQDAALTVADFAALGACLREFPSLGFYNGGREAGASQRHKHLQLIPLPLEHGPPDVPMEIRLHVASLRQGTVDETDLPFRHAITRPPTRWFDHPDRHAATVLEVWHEMRHAAGHPGGPYNLLVTRDWMLFVPRLRECFTTVSINALGFAGALFARDEAEMRALCAPGPMHALRMVAVAR